MNTQPYTPREAVAQIDPKTTRTTRYLLSGALALAALLLLAQPLIANDAPTDTAAQEIAAISADRGGFIFENGILVLALLLLIPAAAGIAQLVRGGRGTALTRTGAAMLGICSAFMALGSWAYGIAGRILTDSSIDPAVATTAIDVGNNDPLIAVSWMVGIGLFFGLIVLGIGLPLAKAAPWWHGALLAVGAALLFFSPPAGIITFLMTLPLAAGLLLLVPKIVNLPAEQYQQETYTGTVPAPAVAQDPMLDRAPVAEQSAAERSIRPGAMQ